MIDVHWGQENPNQRVQWKKRLAEFPTGTVWVGIYRFPLNTNDQFNFSHTIQFYHLARNCILYHLARNCILLLDMYCSVCQIDKAEGYKRKVRNEVNIFSTTHFLNITISFFSYLILESKPVIIKIDFAHIQLIPGLFNFSTIGMLEKLLPYGVMSRSEITPCIKIDKPLVVYRFSGNVTCMK